MNQTKNLQRSLVNMAPGQTPGRSEFFFSYGETIAGVASGTSATGQITIQADAAFMWQNLMCIVSDDVAGTLITSPNATFQIQDQGSGANIFNEELPLAALSGNGQLPFILPSFRVIVASSTIVINVTNVASTNANTFRFVFAGQKLYQL